MINDSRVQSSERATLSETVAKRIQEQILSGELQAGDRLPTEGQLSESLDVSRSVVRDAMRTLAARGLVEVQQGRGTSVAQPAPDVLADAMVNLLLRSAITIGDVLDSRATLERATARVAMHSGHNKDWINLEDRLDDFRIAVNEGDWQLAHTKHVEFHLVIIRAMHLPALDVLLAPMERCIYLTSTPPDPQPAGYWEVEAHEPILEALRASDGDRLEAALDAHYASMYRQYSLDFRSKPFRATLIESTT